MAEKTKWMWEASSYQDGWYHKRILAGKKVPDPSELELPDTLVSKIGTNGSDIVVSEFNTLDNTETKYTLGLGDTYTTNTAFNTFRNEVYKNYATTNEVAKGYVSTGEFEAFKKEFDISNCVTKDYLSSNYPSKTDLNAYQKTTAADSKYLTKTSADTIYQPKGEYVAENVYKTYTASVVTELGKKLNTTDFNTYSASVKTELGKKLNTTDFNTYSASVETKLEKKLDSTDFDTYSASIDTELGKKLDTTDFDTYSANVETELGKKLDSTDFDTYSASIDTELGKKLDTTDFDTYSASVDTELGKKLDITDFDAYSASIETEFGGKIGSAEFNSYSSKIDSYIDDLSGEFLLYQTKADMVNYATELEMQSANHQISAIQDIIHSDDKTLDTIQEIVDFAKHNKDLIDGILTVKQDKSAMSAYYTKTETDGMYLTEASADTIYQQIVDMTAYQEVSGMTAYAKKSELPETYFTKESADTLYQPIGNYASSTDLTYVSGVVDGKVDLSDYNTYTAFVEQTYALSSDVYSKSESDDKYLTETSANELYQSLEGMKDYATITLMNSGFDKVDGEILTMSGSISAIEVDLKDDYIAKEDVTFATDSQIEALFEETTESTDPTDTTDKEDVDEEVDENIEWSSLNFGSIELMADTNPRTMSVGNFNEGVNTPTKEQLETLLTNASVNYDNDLLTLHSKSDDVITYNVGHTSTLDYDIVTIPSKSYDDYGNRYALFIKKSKDDGTISTEISTIGEQSVLLTSIYIKNK
ncbi:MAG: hypothetical protein MJZ34_08125 [Paludibacteraceae bacterium]|nr:hypothetical protein [Paludibacteraceae bacterium]